MELIATLLGGSLLGFVTTLLGQFAKAKAKQQEMMLQAMNQKAKIVDQARQHGLKDKNFAWTRRVIALICVITIVCVPFAAPFLGIPILVSETQEGGFSIPFYLGVNNKRSVDRSTGHTTCTDVSSYTSSHSEFYFGSSAAR